jgi:hypothetical protein
MHYLKLGGLCVSVENVVEKILRAENGVQSDKETSLQRAVWRNGGSNPHEKVVQI